MMAEPELEVRESSWSQSGYFRETRVFMLSRINPLAVRGLNKIDSKIIGVIATG